MEQRDPIKNPDGSGRAERVIRQSRALGDDVRELAGELSEAAREIRSRFDLSDTIRQHPIRTVLVAAGVGYVLGGGLFTPFTGRLIRLGARAMFVPIVKNQIEAMAAGTGMVSER